MKENKKKSKKESFQKAFRLSVRAFLDLRRYCPGLFLATACYAAISAWSPYITIYLTARLIDELSGKRQTEQVWFWVVLLIAAEAVISLIQAVAKHWETKKVSFFEKRKERIFIDKLLNMDYIEIEKQETQDLLSQIWQNEMWSGWGFPRVIQLFRAFIQACLGMSGAIALTISLFSRPVPETAGRLVVLNHPAFLLILLVIMGMVTAIGPVAANRLSTRRAALAKEATFGNRLMSFFYLITSTPSHALDIRMYDQITVVDRYLTEHNVFGAGSRMAQLYAGGLGILTSVAAGLSSLFTGIVYLFTCLKAWAGAFGVGSVTQYVGAVTAFSGNVASLIKTIGGMYSNLSFLQMCYEFLDIPNAMYQGSLTTEKRSDRQYEIEFRDVSFQYPGEKRWALRHVSLSFRVGSRLAIVGENGSGKSTFIKLLCRLYDPQEGQILLNGIDIRKYDYQDYMGIFSVVFQDFQLLAQPLGDNIAGSQNYDRERVITCLRDAGFEGRLAELQEKLHTYLYQDFSRTGIEVSGGEGQKIAIARALYKDASFIILDEPTAALDPIAEAEIYSKFDKIAGDKTAVYISHRLSSCRFCDEILVLEEGMVTQKGTHEELLHKSDGKYAELWNAQAQYYRKERTEG